MSPLVGAADSFGTRALDSAKPIGHLLSRGRHASDPSWAYGCSPTATPRQRRHTLSFALGAALLHVTAIATLGYITMGALALADTLLAPAPANPDPADHQLKGTTA